MKNFSNTVVYLTARGARRLFGNPNLLHLPVVPTEPRFVIDSIVYGDTFDVANGDKIGGIVSQDAFTEEKPTDSQIDAAREAYLDHMVELTNEFGPQYRQQLCPITGIAALLAGPQDEVLPFESDEAKARRARRRSDAKVQDDF